MKLRKFGRYIRLALWTFVVNPLLLVVVALWCFSGAIWHGLVELWEAVVENTSHRRYQWRRERNRTW